MKVTAASVGLSSARQPSRARVTPGAALLVVVVVALLFALVVPLRTFLGERGQLRDLQRREQVLVQQNAKLHAQLLQLHDPAYMEELARRCLGMVRPGEIAFTITPGSGKGSPAAPAGQSSDPASGQPSC